MAKIDPMIHLLNTILDDKEVVIFLGGGASMEGKQGDQQFPGSDDLIDKVLEKFKVKPKSKKERLDSFFSIIEDWKKRKRLSAQLRDFLDGEPGLAHYYLAAFSTAVFGESNMLLYLTKNFDDLIEQAFTELQKNRVRKFKTLVIPLDKHLTGSQFQEFVTNAELNLKRGWPVIIKLFGDLSSQKPIFRQEDMKFEPEVEIKLLEWFEKPMIVIGCSFSDKILEAFLIAARGTAPVFLVNPSRKIPSSIRMLDRVHHIKSNFLDFITDLIKKIEDRNPAIKKRIDKILESIVPQLKPFDTQAAQEISQSPNGLQDSTFVIESGIEEIKKSPRVTEISEKKIKPKMLYNNSWALVIGINKYENEKIPNLNFAGNDAETVAAQLPDLGFPKENIKLLMSGHNKITREAVFDVLETKFNPKMDKDDRFLFYFAGHGISYESNKQKRGYLLMENSELYGEWPDRSNPYLEKIPGRSLEMKTLLEMVKSLPVKHKLLLIDSCFSGFMTYTRGLPDINTGSIRKKIMQWTREPVTQIITAGRSGQVVREKGEYQHGVFTWYLLKGLQGNADPRGDGVISFPDLAAYINDRVSGEKAVKQNPQIGTYEGEGQYIFLYGKKYETDKISGGEEIETNEQIKSTGNIFKAALLAHNGKYTAAVGGGGKLFAASDSITEWEVFTFSALPGEKVNLQIHNGKYVGVAVGGGGTLTTNISSHRAFAEFEIIDLRDNKISLKASNGKFVSVKDGGDYELVANRSKIRAWEIFKLIRL